MNLYQLYNSIHNYNEKEEMEKFLKAMELRCHNLIVCGDKLPFVITDIKPHKELSKPRLEIELAMWFGLHCEFKSDSIVVTRISSPRPLPVITVKENW